MTKENNTVQALMAEREAIIQELKDKVEKAATELIIFNRDTVKLPMFTTQELIEFGKLPNSPHSICGVLRMLGYREDVWQAPAPLYKRVRVWKLDE